MIDTHCHIDLYPNPENLLKELDREGIKVIGVTNLPSHFEIGYNYVKAFKSIRLAIGMHPLKAESHFDELPKFIELMKYTSYVGEVGLDFSTEGFKTKEIQIATFTKILNSLNGQKKLLSIHSRKAEREVLNLLTQNNINAAIFHWYSGPVPLIDKIIEGGYYFSINTAMIKNKSGQDRIARIPSNRILTESDGPFVQFNGRHVKSNDMTVIISYLSEIWGCSYIDADKKIKYNFSTIISHIK